MKATWKQMLLKLHFAISWWEIDSLDLDVRSVLIKSNWNGTFDVVGDIENDDDEKCHVWDHLQVSLDLGSSPSVHQTPASLP